MPKNDLTPAENRVYALIMTGQRTKQIAHALGVSERTIKAHRKAILAKLKMSSTPELLLSGGKTMHASDHEIIDATLTAMETYLILVVRRIIGTMHVPEEAMRDARLQMVAAVDELISHAELSK